MEGIWASSIELHTNMSSFKHVGRGIKEPEKGFSSLGSSEQFCQNFFLNIDVCVKGCWQNLEIQENCGSLQNHWILNTFEELRGACKNLEYRCKNWMSTLKEEA